MPKMTSYRRRLPGARAPRAGSAACLPASSRSTTGNQPLQGVLDLSRGNGGLNASQTTSPQQPANGSGSEHIRLSLVRTTNALSIILTGGPLVASTIAFCVTRSIASFGFLSSLPYPTCPSVFHTHASNTREESSIVQQ